MKAYLAISGTIFGLMALLHLWKIIAEWTGLSIEFWIVAGTGLLAALLSVWGGTVRRSRPTRLTPAGLGRCPELAQRGPSPAIAPGSAIWKTVTVNPKTGSAGALPLGHTASGSRLVALT